MRDQLKFNVKHGRQNLIAAASLLLVFSGPSAGGGCPSLVEGRAPSARLVPLGRSAHSCWPSAPAQAGPKTFARAGLSFSWEFTKIVTYQVRRWSARARDGQAAASLPTRPGLAPAQSRHFSKQQLENIAHNTNLPMYWPSRAYTKDGEPLSEWTFNRGRRCLPVGPDRTPVARPGSAPPCSASRPAPCTRLRV